MGFLNITHDLIEVDNTSYIQIVAIVDNRLVGVVQILDLDSPIPGVSDLFVSGSERLQGIGNAMLDYLLTVCRDQNYKAVRLNVLKTNVQAYLWYRRRGFTETWVSDKEIGMVKTFHDELLLQAADATKT